MTYRSVYLATANSGQSQWLALARVDAVGAAALDATRVGLAVPDVLVSVAALR